MNESMKDLTLGRRIAEAQAKELFTALRDSKYLLQGLPLVSIESPDGTRTRIDL